MYLAMKSDLSVVTAVSGAKQKGPLSCNFYTFNAFQIGFTA